MFRNQIEQLKETQEGLEKFISTMEESIKSKKEELRDVKQAVASLERIQSKYEVQEVKEGSTNE